MGLFATLGKFFRDLVIDVRLGVQETSKISISHESFSVAAKHGGTNARSMGDSPAQFTQRTKYIYLRLAAPLGVRVNICTALGADSVSAF
jgi:hypothetical protein